MTDGMTNESGSRAQNSHQKDPISRRCSDYSIIVPRKLPRAGVHELSGTRAWMSGLLNLRLCYSESYVLDHI
jgi:hypothetical protein